MKVESCIYLSFVYLPSADEDLGLGVLVEHLIDRLCHDHLKIERGAYLLQTADGIVAFGYHAHLELRALDAVASAYHGTKGAVAAELGVARDQEVAHVGYHLLGGLNSELVGGQQGGEEVVHLGDGIADRDGKEVVAIAHARDDTGSDGIDVLQRRGILYATDVAGDCDIGIAAAYLLTDAVGKVGVGGGSGDEGETLARHLFGVGGAADDGKLLRGYLVAVLEVVGNNLVGFGNEALDARHQVALAQPSGIDSLQHTVQKGGGDDEVDSVALLYHLLCRAAEDEARGVEGDLAQISMIAAMVGKAASYFMFAHVPTDLLVGMFEQYLRHRRGP